jgi:hypothetical protein
MFENGQLRAMLIPKKEKCQEAAEKHNVGVPFVLYTRHCVSGTFMLHFTALVVIESILSIMGWEVTHGL